MDLEYVELGGFRIPLIVDEAVSAGTMVLLPGPRRRVEVQLPDGRVVEHGETLEQYARRCVLLRTQ